jgi:aromatic ring-opening dioxygenase catalytic subunit (LigB family)
MPKMPVVFVGHGSPMNAIEDNKYSRSWRSMVEQIPKPEVIISLSAHWYTKGTKIMNEEAPETIYDMYGFPKELYRVKYNSPGLVVIGMAIAGVAFVIFVFASVLNRLLHDAIALKSENDLTI